MTETLTSPAPLKLVICGGGPSAILLLQSLKQRTRRAIDVTILEPRARLGTGVAYSTNCPTHLLNTRACNMSVTDDGDDFVRWLKRERPRRVLNWTREDFAPRSYFADYLQDRLADLRNAANLTINWLHTTADSISPHGNGWEVIPAHGEPADCGCRDPRHRQRSPRARSARICSLRYSSSWSKIRGMSSRKRPFRRMRRCCSPAPVSPP